MAITQLKRYFIIALYPLIDKGVFLKPLEITDGHSVEKIKMEVRNLWRKTRLCATAFLLLVLCLCLPSAGTCSPSQTYQISENELQMLEQHLNALEANNNELLNLLAASTLDLNEASQSLSASKKELETLRMQLTELQAETKSLSESLQTANDELRKAAESFKASEKERDRIEGRLRTQRNIWEVLFAVAVGVAVAR